MMWTPLGELARVSTGYPFRKKVETEEGGDIVLVQIKDVDSAEGVSAGGTIVLRSEGGKYEKHLLQGGDLLFQSRGSRHPVAVVDGGVKGIAATGLLVIRPDPRRVIPGYLAWWLNHAQSQAKLTRDLARGTYIPFISKSDLEAFSVAVPPLAIQAQIVEVDRLQRLEQKLGGQLDRLKQQVVHAATWMAATQKSPRTKIHV
jgi:restriction endonuclease S subunit